MNTERIDRIMVFIDLRNIVECGRSFSKKIKPDIKGLVNATVRERDLVGVYVFDSAWCGKKSSEPLHDELKSLGFNVFIKRGHDKETHKQKEVDMEMGIQIVSRAFKNEYDTAIVITGDRDFLPAIENVKKMGKRVEGAGFLQHRSKKLAKGCNMYGLLDKLPLFYLDQAEQRPASMAVEQCDATRKRDLTRRVPRLTKRVLNQVKAMLISDKIYEEVEA